MCHLVRDFVKQVTEIAYTWKADFHKSHGFDRAAQCVGPASAKPVKASLAGTGGSGKEGSGPAQCCGNGLGRHVFNSNRFECCADGKSREIGSC